MADLFDIDNEFKSKNNNVEQMESTKSVETVGLVMQNEAVVIQQEDVEQLETTAVTSQQEAVEQVNPSPIPISPTTSSRAPPIIPDYSSPPL